MRILKIRWWIPVSLALLLAGAFVAIDYYYAKQAFEQEQRTGLGVAASPSVAWDPRSTWSQRSPRLFAPPAQVPGIIGGVGHGASAGISPSTEEYSAIQENGFVDAAKERLSTVSIDVDTASYTNVRRFLRQGQRPPANAVRIEELLNYFTYSYPDPTGPEPFSITTEIAPCPWTPAHRLLRVGLKSKTIETRDLPPSHLTFLIDVSGSMDHPAKLPLVKRSFALLVEQLRPQDMLAIAVYADAEGLILPPTPGSQKGVILDAIDRLEAGGSTAGGSGIQLAYKTARTMYRPDANNRVILATDGDFNVGVSSDDELIKLVETERNHGVFLTVLGYGMGNLKDGKLEKLADHGNGHYAYIDSILEARRVFVEQLGATLQTVAKDVKFQLDFNPARIRSYRLVGYENRKLTAEEFLDDRKDAGDLGAGHTVTALYELVPNGTEPLPEDSFTLRLRYKPPQSNQSVELAVTGSAETARPSSDLRFAAAVAQFGMLLKNSQDKGGSTFETAIALAQSAISGDSRRTEFLELLGKASEMN